MITYEQLSEFLQEAMKDVHGLIDDSDLEAECIAKWKVKLRMLLDNAERE